MTELDGNALAGALVEATGIDATADRIRCPRCAGVCAVAQTVAVRGREDAVARCPNCRATLFVIDLPARALALEPGVEWVARG